MNHNEAKREGRREVTRKVRSASRKPTRVGRIVLIQDGNLLPRIRLSRAAG